MIPDDFTPSGYIHLATFFFVGDIPPEEDDIEEGDGPIKARLKHNAQRYLNQLRFTRLYLGKTGALRATVAILQAIEHPAQEPLRAEGFQTNLLTDAEAFAEYAALAQRMRDTATAADWMAQWKRGVAVRETLQTTMKAVIAQMQEPAPTVLVGYPHQFLGFAASNPGNVGPTREGDIVAYYVSRNPHGEYHFHAVHLVMSPTI